MNVVPPCNCKNFDCLENPHSKTAGIYFKLKDKITGNDILTSGTGPLPVPDSIKLKDFRTGYSYRSFIGSRVNESNLYSLEYNKPATIVDSVVFMFGNATPDTLIVHTAIVTRRHFT